MTGFVSETAALHAASHQLGVVAEDLGRDFGVVRGQIDQLIGGGWSGAAARSFAAGWQEWEHGYRQAERALREMGELLSATGCTYEKAESATHGTLLAAGGEVL